MLVVFVNVEVSRWSLRPGHMVSVLRATAEKQIQPP